MCTIMTNCQLPTPITSKAAHSKLAEVAQRRKSLSASAQERFAARELGIDTATLRAALKAPRGRGAIPAAKRTAKKNTPPITLPEDPYDLFLGRSGATHSSRIGDAISVTNIQANKIKPQRMKLDAGDVIAGQDQTVPLGKRHLQRLLETGVPKPGTRGYYKETPKWAGYENVVATPLAVRIGDVIYMINGHHRMITGKLLSQKINVDVYDITAFIKTPPKIRYN